LPSSQRRGRWTIRRRCRGWTPIQIGGEERWITVDELVNRLLKKNIELSDAAS
jgi:hypothetical protein